MTDAEEHEMTELRSQWRNVRADRLARRKILLEKGMALSLIRKDHEHKRLRKEQDRLTTRLRHLNAERSREYSNMSKVKES